MTKTLKYLSELSYLEPTAIEAGETPGLIPNPEVKPRLVPRCTALREGAGSAGAVGSFV